MWQRAGTAICVEFTQDTGTNIFISQKKTQKARAEATKGTFPV